MYTVRQFRENLREAFNKAEAGNEVIIERYNETYRLSKINVAKEVYEAGFHQPLSETPSVYVGEIPITGVNNIKTYNVDDDPTYTDPEATA